MKFLLNSVTVLVIASRLAGAFETEAGVIQLSCSDNATCIDNLTKELVKSIREQKAVKVFDFLTIEPMEHEVKEDARTTQGAVARFLGSHAMTFDLGQYAFRLTKSSTKSGAMDLDVLEERSISGEGRRRRRKVAQMILPIMLGMKSASTVIVAIAAVAMLTFKAFVASKIALIVTGIMAAKRLMESFGTSAGFQHHPYLYSHYPIEFPTSSGNAYSMGGIGSGSYSSPDVYGATALGSHSHTHEMLQQGDASAQQSQATAHIVNATRASDRWDGIRRKQMFYGPSRATSDTFSDYQEFRH